MPISKQSQAFWNDKTLQQGKSSTTSLNELLWGQVLAVSSDLVEQDKLNLFDMEEVEEESPSSTSQDQTQSSTSGTSQLPSQNQLLKKHRVIDFANDKVAWAKKCKIVHPVRGEIPLDPYFYQCDFLTDISPERLFLKSRQTGVSQIAAVECLHDALYQPGYVGLLISKDLDSAKNNLSYIKTTYNAGCPKPDDVKLIKDNTVEIRFSNGSRIKSIAATKSAGRSFAASHVYLDEQAFPIWAAEIYRSVSPTISTGGRITIFSTPNGRANLFYELWTGEIGAQFSKHRVHWSDNPAYYTPDEKLAVAAAIAAGLLTDEDIRQDVHFKQYCKWYQANRPKSTAESWAQEFDCDFVQSGNACFNDVDVEALFKSSLTYEEPIKDAEYVSFWDVGRKHDFTVGFTARIWYDEVKDRWRKKIVAYERFTGRPFQIISNRIDGRHIKYGGASYVESNSTGSPVIEMCKQNIKGHYTGPQSKIDMISSLIFDVENHTYEGPMNKQLRSELLMYQWEDKGLTTDCVMALAGLSLYSKETRKYLDVV